MITDQVLHYRSLHITLEMIQMEEALITLCIHRIFKRRQHLLVFHSDQHGIHHTLFGISRVHAASMDRDHRRCCIEVFIFYLTEFTAIYCIGKLRSKTRNIEPVCTTADLLVRGESNADLAVRNFFVGKQISCRFHDFCHACFIVCSKKRGTIRRNQILTLIPFQKREFRNTHKNLFFLVQADVFSIVIFYELWFYIGSGQSRCGIHMGNKAERRNLFSLIGRNICRNFRINITILTETHTLGTHFFQFLFETFG